MWNLFRRIAYFPNFLLLCLMSLNTTGEAHLFNLVSCPLNNSFVKIAESEYPSWSSFVMVNPPVTIYQSTKEVGDKMTGDGFENFSVSFSFEFVPSGFFEGLGEWHRCDTEPRGYASGWNSRWQFDDFVFLLDGMGASNGCLKLEQMVFVSSLKGNSDTSGFLISSTSTDVPICKDKSQPVCFLFVVDFFKKTSVQRVFSTSVRNGASVCSRFFESPQYGFFADVIFFAYFGSTHPREIVVDDGLYWYVYSLHGIYHLYYWRNDRPSKEECQAGVSSTSSKAQKARKLGTECISEEQLMEMTG